MVKKSDYHNPRSKMYKKNKDAVMTYGDILHVDISLRTFLIGLGIIAAVLLLIEMRVVFLLLFISFILMSSFRPIIYKLVEGRIAKPWAIIIVYSFFLIIFSAITVLVSFPILRESTRMVERFPELISDLSSKSDLASRLVNISGLNTLSERMSENLATSFSADNLQAALSGVFGALGLLISAISVLIISAYLVAQRDSLLDDLLGYIPNEKTRRTVKRVVLNVEQQLGLWFRGWILHSVTVAILTFVALSIIGMPFALSLAVIAGILEIIPSIGPILAAIPALIVAAATGNIWMVLLVVVIYIGIATLEANVITPFIMRKVVGINPLITLIAILIGAELAGAAGVLIAVPSVVVLQVVGKVLVKEYSKT